MPAPVYPLSYTVHADDEPAGEEQDTTVVEETPAVAAADIEASPSVVEKPGEEISGSPTTEGDAVPAAGDHDAVDVTDTVVPVEDGAAPAASAVGESPATTEDKLVLLRRVCGVCGVCEGAWRFAAERLRRVVYTVNAARCSVLVVRRTFVRPLLSLSLSLFNAILLVFAVSA